MNQPMFKAHKKELESCLTILYRMLDNIHDYDGMEIANYMSCRDDAQLAIEQLDGNIDLSQLPDVFKQQVLSYLKATGLKPGILINFGTPSVEYTRIIN